MEGILLLNEEQISAHMGLGRRLPGAGKDRRKMGIIVWIVVGLIAGFLAKLAIPGTAEEPSGWFMTMILGIAGAILGGWIWKLVLGRPNELGIDIGSIIVAFVGSCILIALLRLFRGRRAA